MMPLSNDTSPEAEEVQIALLRRASPARRFELMRSLSATTHELAWQGIRKANLAASDLEIDLLFIEYHHGRELALAVRNYLSSPEYQQRKQKLALNASVPTRPSDKQHSGLREEV